MKICYLYLHRFAGRGSGRYMQSLLSNLKSDGHEIHIVEGLRSKLTLLHGMHVKYVHFPFQVPVYVGRTDVKKNVKISSIPDSKLFSIATRFSEWAININEKVGLDIVHASHASILPFAACMTKRVNDVPYVVTAHGTGIQSSLESERNLRIARMGLDESERVIANSGYIKDMLVGKFGTGRNKVKVIYPGVDTDLFKPVSKRMRNAIKRRYGCEGKKVVLSSGFFTEKRGFRDVIEAARMYEAKDPGIVTLITGQGPYQNEMEALIEKSGLKNTKVLGWMLKKDLVKLYSASDLFVTAPVWDEPFGLVPAESLASGTPVIATKVGGLPEIVTGDVGELVPPSSPGSIASAVLGRIDDEEWKQKRSKNARKRALSMFSATVSCRETERLYRNALK